MASIAYGIDGNGRKIDAKHAYSHRTYRCPYCFEDITVRKPTKKEYYFAHKPIHNRTPQQMLCPGYTGSEEKIEAESDKICIINGGVPLHLVTKNKKYELIAIFPPISTISLNKMQTWNTMVEITNDGQKEVYSAFNLHRYKVRTTSSWIKVKCINSQEYLEEVKKKWEWGIRGLVFDTDLFDADLRGGCRVAQHSNIVVGKEYLFIHGYGVISAHKGIMFKKVGQIELKYISRTYDVYSLVVNEVTNDSVAYIQSKGYQLIEKSDEVVPLWPPAVIEGKELIYTRGPKDAYFYHKRESNQKIYLWNRQYTRVLEEEDNIICTTINNTALVLSDYEFNILSKEIKYILTQDRNNYNYRKTYDVNMSWIDNNGVKIIHKNELPTDILEKSLYLQSNYKTQILVLHNGIVEQSLKGNINRLKNGREVYIINLPFSIEHYQINKEVQLQEDLNQCISNEVVKRLYNCGSSLIQTDSSIQHWIKLYANQSLELEKILNKWKQMGQMPMMAKKILDELEVKNNE